jgi:hypothetical protein
MYIRLVDEQAGIGHVTEWECRPLCNNTFAPGKWQTMTAASRIGMCSRSWQDYPQDWCIYVLLDRLLFTGFVPTSKAEYQADNIF